MLQSRTRLSVNLNAPRKVRIRCVGKSSTIGDNNCGVAEDISMNRIGENSSQGKFCLVSTRLPIFRDQ